MPNGFRRLLMLTLLSGTAISAADADTYYFRLNGNVFSTESPVAGGDDEDDEGTGGNGGNGSGGTGGTGGGTNPTNPANPTDPAVPNPFAIGNVEIEKLNDAGTGAGMVKVTSDKPVTLVWDAVAIGQLTTTHPGVTASTSGTSAVVRTSPTCGMSYTLAPSGVANEWYYTRTPLSGSTCKISGPLPLLATTGTGAGGAAGGTGDAKPIPGPLEWEEVPDAVSIADVEFTPFVHDQGADGLDDWTSYRTCFTIVGGAGFFTTSLDIRDPFADNPDGGSDARWSQLDHAENVLYGTVAPQSEFVFSRDGYYFNNAGAGLPDEDNYNDHLKNHPQAPGQKSSERRLCGVVDGYRAADAGNYGDRNLTIEISVSSFATPDATSPEKYASVPVHQIPYGFNGLGYD